MLDFGYKSFPETIVVLFFELATFSPHLVNLGQKGKERHQFFFNFKMAAAAMLESGYQAFFDIIDVLIFKVATFPANIMEIGKKIRERHHFFEVQDCDSWIPVTRRFPML